MGGLTKNRRNTHLWRCFLIAKVGWLKILGLKSDMLMHQSDADCDNVSKPQPPNNQLVRFALVLSVEAKASWLFTLKLPQYSQNSI
jgi:hypothetical protein